MMGMDSLIWLINLQFAPKLSQSPGMIDVIQFALLLLHRIINEYCTYRTRGKRHHRNLTTSRNFPKIVMYSYLKMCMQMWDGGPVGLRSFVERLTTCSSALFKIRQAIRLGLMPVSLDELIWFSGKAITTPWETPNMASDRENANSGCTGNP